MPTLESGEGTAARARRQWPEGDGPEPDGSGRSWPARRRWPMPEDGKWPAAGQARSSLYVWTGASGVPGRSGDGPEDQVAGWAGEQAHDAAADGAPRQAVRPPATPRRPRYHADDASFLLGAIPVTARAAIGDDLRRPALWCELGACISRFSDRSALGEQDNRRLALAAGWRQDAFGRWLCPGCLDRHPYWNTQPLIPHPAVANWESRS